MYQETANPDSKTRLAAIDIGTNTIRLIIVEVNEDGTYRVLDEEREPARLGHGLYDTGKLGEGRMDRAVVALGRMKAIAEGKNASEIRAIATAAVREATNGRSFRRRVQRELGLRINIISSRKEARLAFLSVTRQFSLDGRPVAMVDIGGGSVELVLAAGTVIDQIYSLPLGAVRLTERYVGSGPLSAKKWKKLRKAIDREINKQVGKPPFKAQTMIGSGGTFSTLAAIIKNQREGKEGSVQGYALTRGEVDALVDRLREMPLEARRRIPGLNPDRADIIVAGAASVARLAKRLGCKEIRVNEGGVREGLLLSIIAERLNGGAPARRQLADRMDWVRVFARKCHSNEGHCEHVANLATQIFDSLQAAYDLPEEGREILQAAALLHDIGYLISHARHHKHSYHLIMHGDLPAFSAREVELIANVARYHRRAYPKRKHANLARLRKRDRRLVRFLGGILRVADGLDRTHAQAVTSLSLQQEKGRIRLIVEAEAPPQVELWDADRKAGLFEKAFATTLELQWAGAVEPSPPEAARLQS